MRTQQKPIIILGPMESESAALTEALKNRSDESVGAYTFHKGTVDSCPVVVCRCGIGVVNSAAAAALAIQRFKPLCVIIQGTSGAHNPALHQGDIVLGEKLVNIGRYFTPHRDKGAGSDSFAWDFQGSEIASVNSDEETSVLYGDKRILDIAFDTTNPDSRIIRGTIGAADIWNRELDMIAHLHETLGTDCEEMEGFGVAQVCAQLGVPCADIRIISNSEWYSDEEFDQKYGESCQMFVLQVIRRMIADNTLM